MTRKNVPPPTLLAFLKAPRRGTVKTRLAATIGDDRALSVYRHLAASQLERLPHHWSLEIHYAPDDAESEMRRWLGSEHRYEPQCEGDLGAKLRAAIQGAFGRGAESVVCIGADCPELDGDALEEARAELEGAADVVYGPSDDGGYYLVGLRQPQPELFADVPWSAATTLDVSLERAGRLGLRVALLAPSFDIDEASDLRRAVDHNLLPTEFSP